MVRAFAVFVMLVALPVAAEEVYKCKGADGSTVFAPKPCGSDAKAVAIRPAPIPPPAASAPATQAQPAAASGSTDEQEAERKARAYADSVQGSCVAEIDDLNYRIHQIEKRNMKMEPYSMFASDAELEARRQSALRPLFAERDRIESDCQQRWREAYQAARFH